jgi:hypothetical protein
VGVGISCMNKLKSVGDSMAPCGTPLCSLNDLEV